GRKVVIIDEGSTHDAGAQNHQDGQRRRDRHCHREVSLWSAALLGGARRCLVLLLVLLLAALLPGCPRRGLVLLLVLVTPPRRPGPLVAVHRLVLFPVAALPGPPSRGLVLLLVVVAAPPPGLLVAVRRFVLLRLTRCHGQGGGDLLFGWWGLSSAG